ncbi:hypothetical protein ACMHYB_01410 [Sorangium sp. So ce1128]
MPEGGRGVVCAGARRGGAEASERRREEDDGTLFTRLLKVIPEVNQTLGVPEEEYLKLGSFSRDNPSCP